MADLERGAESFDVGDDLEGRAQLRPVPAVHVRGFYEAIAKPLLDRIAGIALTLVTLPIVLVIVPAIWMQMGGPAIFRQRRVGRFGEEFMVYKFRTMETDRRASVLPIGHDERRVNHKSQDDPRHTDLGRFLRKWSLDEVPQFWNVALGSMSLVGPRPELPSIVDGYEPWQHRRHEVKPGLTGLWQVSARGGRPMHEATDIDIAYVDDVTFMRDARILVQTPGAALGSQQGH